MNAKPDPPKELVLVGGGHTHVQVVKSLGERPLDGVRTTLLSREVQAPYSGMLPGLVAGHYEHAEAHIDLAGLCRRAGVRLVAGEAGALDLDARRVRRTEAPPVSFDVLSLNVGGTPAGADAPGVREHAVAVKPVNRFLEAWRALAARVRRSDGELRVAVVGGGAGGVELGLAAHHRLRRIVEEEGGEPARLRFELFTDADDIVPDHPEGVRHRLRRILTERGFTVRTGARVAEVEADAVVTDGGARHRADATLWVTGVTAPGWIGRTGLDTTREGFVRVDAALRSTSHPFVFAAGDVAHVEPHPRPRAGVFAVRQGPPLDRNLRRVLAGAEPRDFEPQERFLSLVSTGDRYAVGSWARLSFEGRWVWRLKDWIDRRWMARFSEGGGDCLTGSAA